MQSVVWTITMYPEEMYGFYYYPDLPSNKSEPYAAEAFLSIYETATMIRRLPHPRYVKLSHKPTVTASHTMATTTPIYIFKSHGVLA